MSLLGSLKFVLSRPHREAYPFLGASGAVTVVARYLGWRFKCPVLRAAGTAGGLFFGFCLYFFRDPERTAPAREGLVLAPADGRIVSIEKIAPLSNSVWARLPSGASQPSCPFWTCM